MFSSIYFILFIRGATMFKPNRKTAIHHPQYEPAQHGLLLRLTLLYLKSQNVFVPHIFGR